MASKHLKRCSTSCHLENCKFENKIPLPIRIRMAKNQNTDPPHSGKGMEQQELSPTHCW